MTRIPRVTAKPRHAPDVKPKAQAPYPYLSEAYQGLAHIFGTREFSKHTAAKGKHAINDLVAGGDDDWQALRKLPDELFGTPLVRFTDDVFAQEVAELVQAAVQEYVSVVTAASLEHFTRAQALPFLAEHHFLPMGTEFLEAMRERFGGPELDYILSYGKGPVRAVIDWYTRDTGKSLITAACRDEQGLDKTAVTRVDRWNKHVPQLKSIEDFCDRVFRHGTPSQRAIVPALRRWLVLSRALAYCAKSLDFPAHAIMRAWLGGGPSLEDRLPDIRAVFAERQQNFTALLEPQVALDEQLDLASPKQAGDQERAKSGIESFERLTVVHDPNGLMAYHTHWWRGRWWALCGRFDEALPCYSQAFELADFRCGDRQTKLIEEAIALAAFLNRRRGSTRKAEARALLKRLKNRGITLGLFREPIPVVQTEGVSRARPPLLSPGEVDRIAWNFARIFPLSGRFDPTPAADAPDPHKVHYTWKPGVSAPLGMLELHAYAGMGRYELFRRKFTKSVSVDRLDAWNASTLLCALHRFASSPGRDRRIVDLLLKRSHKPTTLNTVMSTTRRTLLLTAVRCGEPDIVEKILSMRTTVNVDLRGDRDDVTPLYAAVSKLVEISNPTRFPPNILEILNDPHLDLRLENRWRGFGGVYGQVELTADDIHRLQRGKEQELAWDLKFHTVKKLTQIIELFLDHGADPNAVHAAIGGRTPLMLATVGDLPAIIERMLSVKRQGKPFLRDVDGFDSPGLARRFESANVLALMNSKGLLCGPPQQ